MSWNRSWRAAGVMDSHLASHCVDAAGCRIPSPTAPRSSRRGESGAGDVFWSAEWVHAGSGVVDRVRQPWLWCVTNASAKTWRNWLPSYFQPSREE